MNQSETKGSEEESKKGIKSFLRWMNQSSLRIKYGTVAQWMKEYESEKESKENDLKMPQEVKLENKEVKVRLLNSERALAEEGKRMNHCVGSDRFASSSKAGEMLIFHLENEDKDHSTLSLKKEFGQWRLHEHLGKFNQNVVAEDLNEKAKEIENTINAWECFKKERGSTIEKIGILK